MNQKIRESNPGKEKVSSIELCNKVETFVVENRFVGETSVVQQDSRETRERERERETTKR